MNSLRKHTYFVLSSVLCLDNLTNSMDFLPDLMRWIFSSMATKDDIRTKFSSPNDIGMK